MSEPDGMEALPSLLAGVRGAIGRYMDRHGAVVVRVAHDSPLALAGITGVDGHEVGVFDDGVTFLDLPSNDESAPDPRQVYLYRSDPFPPDEDGPWDDDEWDVEATCTDGVPVPRLRALVAFLSPDEITPTAQRLLLRLCDEHQPATTP
jgi:hypothetical protein